MNLRNTIDACVFVTRSASRVARFARAISAMAVALASSCAPMADTAQTADEVATSTPTLLYGRDGLLSVDGVIGSVGAPLTSIVCSVTASAPGVLRVGWCASAGLLAEPRLDSYLNVLPPSQQNAQQRGTSTLTIYEGPWSSTPSATLELTAKLENGQTWVMVSNYTNIDVPNATFDRAWFLVSAAARATSVSVSGTLAVGQTVTGAYTYEGASNATENGSIYQWYAVDEGVRAAIEGATSRTFVIPAVLDDRSIQFCVTPRNSNGVGGASCSGSYRVVSRAPQLTWYAQSNQQGAATVADPTELTNGQCVNNATVSTFGPLRSYAMTARGVPVTIDVFQSNNCGYQALVVRHTKTVAANTTGTFSFASRFSARSYRVSW